MDGAAAKRTEGKELLGRSQSSPLISVPSPWATLKDGASRWFLAHRWQQTPSWPATRAVRGV